MKMFIDRSCFTGFCMHEWALAESVLVAAVQEAEKQDLKKITEITIQIGQLQQIEQDIFEFALGEIVKTQKGIIEDVEFKIEIERSILKCNNCGNTWNFESIQNDLSDDESESIHFLPETTFVHSRCPKCKSPDFEITEGRGVTIKRIKGEK